jgi:antagonist of KipI
MSIRIIKQGVFDTLQDAGRYGMQHLGINPSGAADMVAYAVANMLVANERDEAVIEMYFPASTIIFENDAVIALSGADFGACLNGMAVPINTPMAVTAGCMLEFTKRAAGNCCYLAIKGGLQIDAWAGSYSTNIKAQAGGYKGRKLQAGDTIPFKKQFGFDSLCNGKPFLKFGWRADVAPLYSEKNTIRICKGHEYNSLCAASKNVLFNTAFTITPQSDRMGYRLQGLPLQRVDNTDLVSTGVTKGTIQLLPSGQLVVLMADHQTTGGYPRIAHIASVDIPKLAQMQTGKQISFVCIGEEEGENLLIQQHQYLYQLQLACSLRLEEVLNSR